MRTHLAFIIPAALILLSGSALIIMLAGSIVGAPINF